MAARHDAFAIGFGDAPVPWGAVSEDPSVVSDEETKAGSSAKLGRGANRRRRKRTHKAANLDNLDPFDLPFSPGGFGAAAAAIGGAIPPMPTVSELFPTGDWDRDMPLLPPAGSPKLAAAAPRVPSASRPRCWSPSDRAALQLPTAVCCSQLTGVPLAAPTAPALRLPPRSSLRPTPRRLSSAGRSAGRG